MATLRARLAMTVGEIEDNLGIDIANYVSQSRAESMLNSCVDWADNYMQNPFVDDDENEEDIRDLYPQVVEGIYRLMQHELGSSVNPDAAMKPGALVEIETKDLRERYGSTRSLRENAFNVIAENYFDQYRLNHF